jgi:putative ABC transport system substrate-binding protein
VTQAAARHRVPAIYAFRVFAASGGLMSYGVNLTAEMRQAAGYVDRVMNGDKPADLPVQQPGKFELVLNLKAAKALGLTIAPTLLAQADEVLE